MQENRWESVFHPTDGNLLSDGKRISSNVSPFQENGWAV
jgi:hypothetical protein